MLAFRALVFTIYNVGSSNTEYLLQAGDHVLVNRWSYGLRTGGGSIFGYGRVGRQAVSRGDLIAIDDSLGRVFITRCTALPGDTVDMSKALPGKAGDGMTVVVPGLATCADTDYYLTDSYGFVGEERIIGRVCMVLFSHDPAFPFWHGYVASRFMLLK